jgi:DNA-binding Lrp family transcriptional regulator
VHARLRRLEQEGYIRGYHAALDYARLGLGLSAFVGIQMPQAAAARRRLIEHLSQIPEVEELVWVTGEFDALLRIRARDTVHLQEAVFRTISAGGGQVRTRTMVVLSEPYWRPGPAFEAVAPEGAAEDGDA